ncbi:phospholipase A2 inhibitor and Ly6/PLAUR domain-containing protein-like [Hypomesus transpacificus]|uniref:phospholipase A2 inhibitor and Ly6/PLAUR domain-containing protein-like n=1 Tax=Hypomesus transpacificus TaxID=137520 RepID=UPI001F078743|nr:phospholipase A2 inhibitor and Ly6/PLAUR domain-containing protein-like [Hypomesus transpacificus]
MLSCSSKMKLILIISITWALLLTVESLHCYSCDPPCSSEVITTCPSQPDSVCLTHTLFVGKTITKGKYCTQSVECRTRLNVQLDYSLNFGIDPMSESVLCCDSDGCNKQTLPVPSQEPNGLQCDSCSNYSDTVCNTPANCVGLEDTCAVVNVSTGVVKGCISSNLCSVSLMATFLASATEDAISCSRGKNIAGNNTGVQNIILSTAGSVTTTHLFTKEVTTQAQTTDSKNTAPSTGPLSVVLMPVWLTMMVKFTY